MLFIYNLTCFSIHHIRHIALWMIATRQSILNTIMVKVTNVIYNMYNSIEEVSCLHIISFKLVSLRQRLRHIY